MYEPLARCGRQVQFQAVRGKDERILGDAQEVDIGVRQGAQPRVLELARAPGRRQGRAVAREEILCELGDRPRIEDRERIKRDRPDPRALRGPRRHGGHDEARGRAFCREGQELPSSGHHDASFGHLGPRPARHSWMRQRVFVIPARLPPKAKVSPDLRFLAEHLFPGAAPAAAPPARSPIAFARGGRFFAPLAGAGDLASAMAASSALSGMRVAGW